MSSSAQQPYRNFFEEDLMKESPKSNPQNHVEPRKRVEKQSQAEDRPKRAPKNKKNNQKKPPSAPATNEDADPEQPQVEKRNNNSQKQNSREPKPSGRGPKSKWVSKDKPKEEEQGEPQKSAAPTINAQNVVEKSTVLFELWKSTQANKKVEPTTSVPVTPTPIDSSPKKPTSPFSGQKPKQATKFRDLQSAPSTEDLQSALFFESNTFEDGEIVLLPRTRGGFSYGKIQKQSVMDTCFYNESISSKTSVYTVLCSSSGKNVSKAVPTSYIGKLNASETGNTPAEAETTEINRFVGEKPAIKDLLVVEFNAQLNFAKDEVVLVPRSSGGFTYGKLIQSLFRNCPLHGKETSHDVVTWVVMVSMDKKKEVFAGSLGKIQKISANAARTVFDRTGAFAQANDPHHHQPGEKLTRNHHRNMERDEYAVPHRRRGPRPDRKQRQAQPLHNEDEDDEINLALPVVQNPLEGLETPQSLLATSTVVNDEQQHSSSGSSKHSSQSSQESAEEGAPSAKQEKVEEPVVEAPKKYGGVLTVDKQEFLKSLFKDEKGRKHLIVLDGPNVAKKHGKDTDFSAEGIRIAMEYWQKRGHDCIAFLPQHYVSKKPTPGVTRTLDQFITPSINNFDKDLLQDMVAKGSVILTPAQDYDDSYCIKYAREHDGVIVTNDRYMDHLKKIEQNRGEHAKLRQWVRSHIISFTFVRDDFLPNPEFKFPPFASPLETS